MKKDRLYEKKFAFIITQLASQALRQISLCNFILLYLMMNLSLPAFGESQLKAFICAQGFGAISTGGRGGSVYHVTKLSDDGSPGTLRYGIEKAQEPQIIVFDLGGIIRLNSILVVKKKSNITIAGQTASGGGITLSGYRFSIVDSSNITVRYLRFRLGDFNARIGKWGGADPAVIFGNGNKDMFGEGGDAITIYKSDKIILDHISASWGIDENVAISDSNNITIQNSIISEGLLNSFHIKGPHSMGLLMTGGASDDELKKGKGGYTVYRNLFAHNNMRNPLVSGQIKLRPGQSEKDREFQGFDFTNNVVYNWGSYSGHQAKTKIKLNYINNYLIAGPSTTPQNINTAMIEHRNNEGNFYFYASGNYMDTDKNRIHNGKLVGREAFINFEPNENLSIPFPWPIDNVLSAEGAYQNILAIAGASLVRDAIDLRIINELKTRTGKIINSQKDVGGLEPIDKGIAPVDTDRDGIPDSWELANGLNPNNASDRNGTNLNKAGYTNIEVYLDSIVTKENPCEVASKKEENQKNVSNN